MILKDLNRVVRIATIAIIVYLFLFAAAMAFFPIRPFWNDEWRLIYNIKFKNIHQLWGRLDLLQECPRVYLSVLKMIASIFDYSYVSLRLPPLIIGSLSAFFIFRIKNIFFNEKSHLGYLFILILISSQTFTDYLTQVKQYEMDIFLCLLSLWQLKLLLDIGNKKTITKFQYSILCFSFFTVPFLSYIYPITVAPIFPVVFLLIYNQKQNYKKLNSFYFKILLPLTIVTISIIIFYFIDVKNVMSDKNMYLSYLKAYYKGSRPSFFQNVWNLFALVGSGFLFEIIFGILGVASLLYGIYKLLKTKLNELAEKDYFLVYAVFLLFMVLFLLMSGKLIGGVARLTAYTVPSIALLIIALLKDLKEKFKIIKITNASIIILFLGLFGNIISTCINSFTYSEYKDRISTYWNTSRALKNARLDKIPLMISDGVCGDPYIVTAPFPEKIKTNTIDTKQILGADTLCAEAIVKVNPEYKIWDTIPIFYMPDSKWMNEYFKQLPPEYHCAIVGDGINFKKLCK